MNTLLKDKHFIADALTLEWERLELLCHCLQRSRQGQEVDEALLNQLQRVKGQVDRARQTENHALVAHTTLTPLEIDILACAVAPEAEPRLGWLFNSLQLGASHPHPTPALIQELFALDTQGAHDLYRALSADSPLKRLRLITTAGEGPYHPIQLARGVSARLLGRPQIQLAPPGALPVPLCATWGDLVLPADRITMLKEFIWLIKHRHTVVGEWGGIDNGGPLALFSGPSGTGKTLAASVLATELSWPLYRVDLGQLVSKYIGETEKNINQLFDSAHGVPMVLLFDEADSIFGKRGEVKNAHDRYANLEVSHLLSRVELHQGPCILTTNLQGNIDTAFTRRFHMVVDFSRPDAAARAHIWSLLLPPRAPRTKEVNPEFLGKSVNLTGGAIRNAALHAAYLAAGHNETLALHHIALAVWRELGKDGREVALNDMGPLAEHLSKEYSC